MHLRLCYITWFTPDVNGLAQWLQNHFNGRDVREMTSSSKHRCLAVSFIDLPVKLIALDRLFEPTLFFLPLCVDPSRYEESCHTFRAKGCKVVARGNEQSTFVITHSEDRNVDIGAIRLMAMR